MIAFPIIAYLFIIGNLYFQARFIYSWSSYFDSSKSATEEGNKYSIFFYGCYISAGSGVILLFSMPFNCYYSAKARYSIYVVLIFLIISFVWIIGSLMYLIVQ